MTLPRRSFLRAGAGLLLASCAVRDALAHHGWSSFDQDRPVYLEGSVAKVRWANPHVELELELPPEPALPADLKQRAVPAQTTPVDGAAVLARARLPSRRERRWSVELAPLTRMQAWKVEEIRPGARLAVVGYTFPDEKGDAVLRAEYLFVDGKAYGLRSSPA